MVIAGKVVKGREALQVVFFNFEGGLSLRSLSFRGLCFRGLSFRDTRLDCLRLCTSLVHNRRQSVSIRESAT